MKTKNYKKNNMKVVQSTKKKSVDKNQLLAYILAGLMIFWTIASVFGFIAYGRTKKASADVKMITASAEAPQYYDPNFYVILTPFDGLQYWEQDNATSVRTEIGTVRGTFAIVINKSGVYGNYALNPSNVAQKTIFDANGSYTTNDVRKYTLNLYRGVSSSNYTMTNYFASDVSHWYVDEYEDFAYDYYYIHDVGFYKESNKINNGLYVKITFRYVSGSGYRSKELKIYPFSTQFGAVVSGVSDYLYVPSVGQTMTRNTSHTLSSFYDALEWYNTGSLYANLYKSEEFTDFESAVNNAYRNGREVGYAEGRENGFVEGVASANEYSFDGLLSSVFDVPVRTFRSLFDFNVLGVNLSQFFLSILTVCVVIGLIRLFL